MLAAAALATATIGLSASTASAGCFSCGCAPVVYNPCASYSYGYTAPAYVVNQGPTYTMPVPITTEALPVVSYPQAYPYVSPYAGPYVRPYYGYRSRAYLGYRGPAFAPRPWGYRGPAFAPRPWGYRRALVGPGFRPWVGPNMRWRHHMHRHQAHWGPRPHHWRGAVPPRPMPRPPAPRPRP
jgi:hypothetical protein